jgi:hypothetical protein
MEEIEELIANLNKPLAKIESTIEIYDRSN